MAIGFGRKFFSNAVAYVASAVVVDVLMSKTVRRKIRNGFVGSRDFIKGMCSEGAAAYKRGRDIFKGGRS